MNSKKWQITGLAARAVLRIAVYVVACIVLVYAARSAYRVGFAVFTSGTMAAEPGEDVVVTIGDHMSDRAVGELLESKGLIQDSLVYRIQAKVYEYKPLPGTYLVNTSQTLDRMMEIMSVAPAEEAEE